MKWQTVIGLEVHAQLKTKSKLFSSAPTSFGAAPNTRTHFIDAGLPGVLPVLNKEAVKLAIRFALAINAEINDQSFFERKNYFYQDLPKGYQISQLQRPIVGNGQLQINLSNGQTKNIYINRAHLEEDAGKSIHDSHADYTAVDLNRAGTPLLEIVTEPCIYSSEEAVAYLKSLHQLLRFMGISDGNMQDGSFRCDVNLSLRLEGATKLGTRTELKNLNSFKFIEKAIEYEICRQQDLLESNIAIIQETCSYNPNSNTTESMRKKEGENDYRYFPDPDLLPIKITNNDIEDVRKNMPSHPSKIKQQLIEIDKLSEDNISFLFNHPATLEFYFTVKGLTKAPVKLIVNWLKGHYAAALNERGLQFDSNLISSDKFAQLLDRINDKSLSNNNAKIVFTEILESECSVDDIIKRKGFDNKNDNTELRNIVKLIIDNNQQQVADYRAGKDKLWSFFVGMIMKQTKGQADPQVVNDILGEFLS